MKIRMVSQVSPFFAASLTGVLLFLAFPKCNLGWIVWGGLVPLLLSLSSKCRQSIFVVSYFSGIVFYALVFKWAFEIPGYKLIHHVILGIYLGLYFGIFGLALKFVCNRRGITMGLAAAPFLWVSLEFIRSNFSFLALPWALLAHTQYKYFSIIQISSLTGAYGLSFLIVLVNSALTILILWTVSRSQQLQSSFISTPTIKSTVLVTLVAAISLCLEFAYGRGVLSESIEGEKIKLSVLQGNIGREIKTNPKLHSAYIMQKYTDLTKRAALDQPDLIIWPEAATPGFVLKNVTLYKEIVSLIREIKIPLLIGSSEYAKFANGEAFDPKEFGNTVLFFSKEGKILDQYLKIRLVPFGEYIPYENTIPWPNFIVPEDKRGFEKPGTVFTIYNLGQTRFGAIICWEVVFPRHFSSFVRNGASLMINLTNEGWFGDSSAPHQMVAIVVFRAVENRLSIARAANNGISCFIDQFGRITGSVKDINNKETFVEGYLTNEISLASEKTFYTRYGDVFVYLSLVISVLSVVLCFRSKND